MKLPQITFRVNRDEKRVIDILAKLKGIRVSEFTKQVVLKEIEPVRVDLAFELLKKGKIGRKQAWILSGLSANEFLIEWTERGAEEVVPKDLVDWELDILKKIDLKSLNQDSL